MADRIAYWKGRPVEDMTREELVDALNILARQVERERELHMRSLDVLGDPRPFRP